MLTGAATASRVSGRPVRCPGRRGRSRTTWPPSSGWAGVRAGADPQQAALILLAMLFGLAVGPLPASGRVDAELVRAAVDLLMVGLAPEPG